MESHKTVLNHANNLNTIVSEISCSFEDSWIIILYNVPLLLYNLIIYNLRKINLPKLESFIIFLIAVVSNVIGHCFS